MTERPVGTALPHWRSRSAPPATGMVGEHCRLEPLEPDRHAADLHDANALDAEGLNWTYLPYGPFGDAESYREWVGSVSGLADPQFFAVVDVGTDRAVGVASYLRVDPTNGVVEVGHINYSPLLQRTTAGTEAMWLMMRRVFEELGYRRYEWKCDALNAASRAAAERLGFTYEGVFRQAAVYKGRNRDTAWYSVLDSEWPTLDAAFRAWLDPANLVDGRPARSLAAFR